MVKWQTVALWLMGIFVTTGTVTYVDLFSGLFQLSGISYTNSGDIFCQTECNSTINVTTTYWNIGFEHSKLSQTIYIDLGDGKLTKTTIGEHTDTILYKKWRYGRKLWINLNNIDNIISTKPKVSVDWLVPTRGKDNWRPIKEGDSWNRLKNNKIKLVGHKQPEQTVKWGFNIKDYIDIDPVWLPTSSFKPIIKCDILTRTEYDTCAKTVIRYINFTFINNATKLNESMMELKFINSTYNCNAHQVSYKENCKVVGFNTTDLTATCPSRYRCDIIGNQFCYVSLDDGDKNFNFKQADGRGWDGGCVDIPDLKEGNLKVSSYRKIFMKVKRK